MESRYDPDTQVRYDDIKKEYVDLSTGEITSHIETKATALGRKRYYRIMKGSFYKALSVLDGNSMKAALYIVENCNSGNIFLGSYVDLQHILGVSNKTITSAMVKLQENDIIRMAHPSQWMFNPNLAVSCYDDDIPFLLTKYYSITPYRIRRPKKKESEETDNAH